MSAASNRAAAVAIAAVLSSAGIATPLVLQYEGWELIGYKDPVGIATACAGVTKGVELNRRYTPDECRGRTAQALVEHGMGIAKCLPAELPPNTRAAYTAFAYNVGVAKFCGSTLAAKARAGDLRGSCAELSKWVNAGGKPMKGLIRRRAAERQLCEKDLK